MLGRDSAPYSDDHAEVRYLVLPERPAGAEGAGEEELAARVTRDAMIGAQSSGCGSSTRSPTIPTVPTTSRGRQRSKRSCSTMGCRRGRTRAASKAHRAVTSVAAGAATLRTRARHRSR
ncbi:MAG: hypothetical protein E6G06_17020 [Actinobacteria bacterium]|nr:MAG: hypothetical protein E6G06_17020 [Actinomycetota bacterium]